MTSVQLGVYSPVPSVARPHINRGVIARNYSNGGYTGIKVALSIVRTLERRALDRGLCESGLAPGGQRSILFPRSSLIAFRASRVANFVPLAASTSCKAKRRSQLFTNSSLSTLDVRCLALPRCQTYLIPGESWRWVLPLFSPKRNII